MQTLPKNKSGYQPSFGFIKILVLGIVLVIIFTILNIDIRGFVQTDLFQSNFNFFKEIVLMVLSWITNLWLEYGAEPTLYLWEKFLLPLIG